MTTPEILKGWVAEEGQLPTDVVNPCSIDHTAVEDLVFYHPGFDSSTPHSFMHVAADDNDGRGPYVRADPGAFSYNWERKMETVMCALKLFPTTIDGHPALIDEAIRNVDTPRMHGWKVIHWIVVKNRDTSMQLVHQDWIRWQDASGKVVESMFSWRPYRALQVQPALKGLITNGRVFLEVARSR
jgi:hypothetical protein